MRRAHVHVLRAHLLERARGFRHGAGRVDHVVDEDAVEAFDFTDNVHDFRYVRRGAPLVDDRQRGVQAFRESARHLRGADIGRDDGDFAQVLLAIMGREHRHRVEMIDGDVEESLELVLVKIETEHAVSTRRHDHVGQQLGADRDPRLVLAILSRVAVVRHHDGNARRACALGCVDQQQKLEYVVRRRIRRLDDEHVVAANVLVDPDEDLAVGKT